MIQGIFISLKGSYFQAEFYNRKVKSIVTNNSTETNEELRGMDLNHRPLAYEASELPLLYPAIVASRKCIGEIYRGKTTCNIMLFLQSGEK